MNKPVLFLLTFTTLFCYGGRENYSQLRQLYKKQLERYDFVSEKVLISEFDERRGEMWNLAVYGEELWGTNFKGPQNRVGWLNAAIVYRVFCSYENSPLWQRMGHGYQAVKLREHNLGPVGIKTLLQMKVPPKYQELYLLYGQHCSLLLKLIEKELFSRLNEQLNLNGLVELLEKDELVALLQKRIPTDNLQQWYETNSVKFSSGIYSIMPEEYIADKFKEILTIEIFSEVGGKKEHSENDIKTAVVFGLDRQVVANVGAVYSVLAQRLWFDAPPMLRPSIAVAIEAFGYLAKGDVNIFSDKLSQSVKLFSRDIKRSRKIKEWLDITETAITTDKARLQPYRDILKDKRDTGISSFLDEIEDKLEKAKE